jgi:hypothetical protein
MNQEDAFKLFENCLIAAVCVLALVCAVLPAVL